MCTQLILRLAWAVCMKKIWVITATHWAHSEVWSDWVDAQADLSLFWAHRSFSWFCHASAQMISMNTCWEESTIAALQIETNYVLLYLIMLFWNIWHVKIYLKWPNISVEYGLGWQWPTLHNTFTVFEWAYLWGVEIITEKGALQGIEGLQK